MATATRRTPTRTPTRTTNTPKQAGGYRGAEGRKMAEIEEQRSIARKEAAQLNSHMPFRFFCPVGESREFVIIDDAPDFFRHEHCMKDPRTKRWSTFCECIAENANCPVCKVAERPSYFGMFLTIIDLEPYVNNEGNEVPWSKKLLMVKTQQQKKFTRLHREHGTLRGMVIRVTRDGEKDASIGNDIEFVEFMEEDQLLEYETIYIDKKDKEHEILGHEVFDYDELFPRPTEQQLRALVGGKAEPGSRDADDAALGRRRGGSGDDWDDNNQPAARRMEPVRSASRATSRTTREQESVEDQPAEEAAEQAPRRSARGAAPVEHEAPARTTARAPARRAQPVAEPAEEYSSEGDDHTESDAPTRRSAPARNTTRTARPDPEQDDSPQRNTASLAERRRQLRR